MQHKSRRCVAIQDVLIVTFSLAMKHGGFTECREVIKILLTQLFLGGAPEKQIYLFIFTQEQGDNTGC